MPDRVSEPDISLPLDKIHFRNSVRQGDLHSEHDENSEYDRALYELVTDAAGLSMEEQDVVAKAIKEKRRKLS